MKLNNNSSIIYIPDGIEENIAISRTTHMAIAAHQDDIEIMAYHGIEKCFQNDKNYFFGCVVTNGKSSARTGVYKNYSDEQMISTRAKEQIQAANLGEYGALSLLNYDSSEVKEKNNQNLISDISNLISHANPEIIYTHNLADKHDTHVAIVINVLKAIRNIPKSKRPKKVYGCEIWRDLDWVNDEDKIRLDVSNRPNLAASLVEIFDSQIVGGKRYDLAAIGRRLANATFSASHEVDETQALTYAIDLTPLIEDDTLDIKRFISSYIESFKKDVTDKIIKYL